MAITTEDIKKLRDQTSLSIMQCKKALEDAKGDVEKALLILKKKGAEIAAKKLDRTIGAGIVASYIHMGGAVGAMVELGCETDFVSRNPEFKTLAYDIAMHVAATSPEYIRFEDVSEDAKKKARELFTEEVANKPAELREKIVEGKLSAFFNERALIEQPFVKNPDQTIKDLLINATQKFGERTEIVRFSRFAVGK